VLPSSCDGRCATGVARAAPPSAAPHLGLAVAGRQQRCNAAAQPGNVGKLVPVRGAVHTQFLSAALHVSSLLGSGGFQSNQHREEPSIR
jgi:hypothetical protein